MRNNYFRSCNPGIGVAFVAVAHWPAGRLPGVSSQRGAGQQRVITRYTSPPLISPKSSEYIMKLEDDRKKFDYLHQFLLWILENHMDCKFFPLRQKKFKIQIKAEEKGSLTPWCEKKDLENCGVWFEERCFAQIEFHFPSKEYCPECDYWREATKTKFTGEEFCLLGNLRNYEVIIKLGGEL